MRNKTYVMLKKKKKTFVSHLFGSTVFADFDFPHRHNPTVNATPMSSKS